MGYTEMGGDKLKRGNGFLEPNFGVGPNLVAADSMNVLAIRPRRLDFPRLEELTYRRSVNGCAMRNYRLYLLP